MKSGLIRLFWARTFVSFGESIPVYSRIKGVPSKAPLSEVTGRNFPAEGKNFDKYFVSPEVRKKPWDGQDKDQYFRDKYAHVHARQKKEREERKRVSPYKAARSFTKNKLGRLEQAEKLGIPYKKERNILVDKKVNKSESGEIKKGFARSFAYSLEKDPRREFIYGTGPVIAALQANKRKILALYTKDERDHIPKVIREMCKSRKLKVECNVPNAHLNIMTNNGIHNKYVLEVRPLEKRQLVSLGNVWEEQVDNEVDSDIEEREKGVETGLEAVKPEPIIQSEGVQGKGDEVTNNLEVLSEKKDKKKLNIENKGSYKLPIVEVEDGKIISNKLTIQYNPKKKYPLVLFVDEVTDAHNFGAIIRSAYYLGVDFIVHVEKNSAKLSPTVDKTSAGSMEHIPIFNVSQPLRFFEETRENGWNIIATSVGSDKAQIEMVKPSELEGLLRISPCMLVIGSEGEGLRTSLLQRSTHVVKWNGFQDTNKLDSLNVSVATGLLLSKFYKGNAFDG